MGTERVLILLNNTSRGAVRKKAVLLNSQVVSKFSFESSLNLPLYLVRVGDHAADLITHPTLTTFHGVFSSSSPGVYFPSPSNYFAIIFLSECQLLGNPNQNNLLSIALGTSCS